MIKTTYSCQEHLEELLDDHLEIQHTMPLIKQQMTQTIKCKICEDKALYIIEESMVKTTWD